MATQAKTKVAAVKKAPVKKAVTGGKGSDSADAASGFVPIKKAPVSR